MAKAYKGLNNGTKQGVTVCTTRYAIFLITYVQYTYVILPYDNRTLTSL